ncbi:MAG: hypothetical protein HKN53_06215 [Maribacter sp.]|nr:hypothetical protein [Maribacter sp.]
MYRASFRVFLTYALFSIVYFLFCSWLVRQQYPDNNLLASFNRLFFWIDGYAIYFSALFLTSSAGMVYSRLIDSKKRFWGFFTVFFAGALVVGYAAIFG